jgi:hypothetical protein
MDNFAIVMFKPDFDTTELPSIEYQEDIITAIRHILKGKVVPNEYIVTNSFNVINKAKDKYFPILSSDNSYFNLINNFDKNIGNVKRDSLLIFFNSLLDIVNFKTIEPPIKYKMSAIEIRKLYPILGKPDLIFGDDWKIVVIQYLQNGYVTFQIFNHSYSDTFSWLYPTILKSVFRDILLKDKHGIEKLVKNFIHVPDENELEDNLSFFYEIKEKLTNDSSR